MGYKTRVHIFVKGRVQGVFFRDRTCKKAKKLELTGWVKNLKNGMVEAVFEGEKDMIGKIIKWIKKGPTISRVDNVELEEQKYQCEFETFEIKY